MGTRFPPASSSPTTTQPINHHRRFLTFSTWLAICTPIDERPVASFTLGLTLLLITPAPWCHGSRKLRSVCGSKVMPD